MDYMELKKRFPMLCNIIGCHFSAEIAEEYGYLYLRRPGLSQHRDTNTRAHALVRNEIPSLFLAGMAKSLLEEDRWFVGHFESEDHARSFIIENIWNVYFPDEPFAMTEA